MTLQQALAETGDFAETLDTGAVIVYPRGSQLIYWRLSDWLVSSVACVNMILVPRESITTDGCAANMKGK